uniref:Kisspeptin n=1 Tax=Takifugu rubripes TaxID=31033 RepID=A0A3B5KNJ8_TAKRU
LTLLLIHANGLLIAFQDEMYVLGTHVNPPALTVRCSAGSVQLRRGTAGQLQLLQESNPCLTFRDNEDQLLCNRSKFNLNPFGLRFGKRFIYRRAMKQARTHTRSPVSQEVPT